MAQKFVWILKGQNRTAIAFISSRLKANFNSGLPFECIEKVIAPQSHNVTNSLANSQPADRASTTTNNVSPDHPTEFY